jgi:hypothetical protein
MLTADIKFGAIDKAKFKFVVILSLGSQSAHIVYGPDDKFVAYFNEEIKI